MSNYPKFQFNDLFEYDGKTVKPKQDTIMNGRRILKDAVIRSETNLGNGVYGQTIIGLNGQVILAEPQKDGSIRIRGTLL